MLSREEKAYYPGIDICRMLAAFGIVGCHLALANPTPGARLLIRFTDFNVGFFAVLSGFFFMRSLIAAREGYLRRRLLHLIVPYVLWIVIFIAVDAVFDLAMHKFILAKRLTPSFWVKAFFLGSVTTHLWFLVWLIYFQAAGYWLFRWFARLTWGWVDFLFFIVSVYLLTQCHLWGEWGRYPVRLFAFMMIDMVFYKHRQLFQMQPIVALGLLIGGIFIQGSGFRYGFISEGVVTFPFFLLGLNVSFSQERLCRLARAIGGLSFGVYLVHPIFATALRVVIERMGWPTSATVFFFDQLLAWLGSLLFAIFVARLSTRYHFLRHLQA